MVPDAGLPGMYEFDGASTIEIHVELQFADASVIDVAQYRLLIPQADEAHVSVTRC